MASSSNGQPWAQQFGLNGSAQQDIVGWSEGYSPIALPSARKGAAAIIIGDKLYVIGGLDKNGTPTSTIYVADVDVNGDIGEFTLQGNLPEPRYYHHVFRTASRLYIIGGFGASKKSSTSGIFYTSINVDNTISSWSRRSLGQDLEKGRGALVYTGQYYYFFGGYSVPSLEISNDTVIRFSVDDSSTEAPTFYVENLTSTIGMPEKRRGHAAFIANDYVYIAGGVNKPTVVSEAILLDSVIYAPVVNGEISGPWQIGTSLPSGRTDGAVIVTSNNVYLVGGKDGFDNNSVFVASTEDGGDLEWNYFDSSIPGTRCFPAIAKTETRVHLIGGGSIDNVSQTGTITNDGFIVGSVISANIDNAGLLSSWKSIRDGINQSIGYASTFITNSLYVAGVYDITTQKYDQVYQRHIDQKTGLLTGSAQKLENTLPFSIEDAIPTIIKPYIYLFGGLCRDADRSPILSTIVRAEVYDDGSIGQWTELSETLVHSIRGITTGVYVSKSYVYLFSDGGKAQRATINNDGTLGIFVNTPDNGLPIPTGENSPIQGSAIISTSSRVYSIGGETLFTPSSLPEAGPFVYYAPINTDGTLGSWVRDQDLPFDISRAKAITKSNQVFLIGGSHNVYEAYHAFIEQKDTRHIYSASIINGIIEEWSEAGNDPVPFETQEIFDIYNGIGSVFITESSVYAVSRSDLILRAPFSGGLNNYIDMSIVDVNVEDLLPEIIISAHSKSIGNEVTFQEPVPSIKVSIAPSISIVDYVPQIEVTALQGRVVSVVFDDLLPIVSVEVEIDQQQNERVVEVLFSEPVPEITISAQAAKITSVSISEPVPEIKINAANGFIVNVVAEEGTPVIKFLIDATVDEELFVHDSPVKQGTLCMNTLNKATTQFTNHQFTSYANFNGMILGTTEEGLFSVCSAARDGVDDIDAHVVFPATDFDVQNTKRLRAVYFGYSSDGQLKLSYSFDDKPTTTYDINAHKTNLQRIRIPVNREQYGRYLTKVKIENVSGSDFYLDQVEALSVILASRRR
jgi:N-acetylneuraminic acid mutarotase